MRTLTILLISAALAMALVAKWIDVVGADPDSAVCVVGLCRKDQLLAIPEGRHGRDQHADITVFRRIAATAPADAYAWALVAEYAKRTGAPAEARAALDRAVELAPATAPILMRRLNFCVESRDSGCVLEDGKVTLRLTDAYDGVIFMYYAALGIGVEDVLKLGLPKNGRALRSFAIQAAKSAKSPNEAMLAWERVRTNGYADEATACGIVQYLVGRGEPGSAWRVWEDYLSGQKMIESSFDRLTDSEFKRNPTHSLFDWSIRPQQGVSFRRQDGLQVQFTGETNLALLNVIQMSYVRPARHRLVVDVSHEGITTNQGPFFRLLDAENPARLDVRTEMIQGSSPRRRIELDFEVPAGTRLVRLQLERTPSEKFDNKIAGTLHLHRIALTEGGTRF